jgi:hypothetical protein
MPLIIALGSFQNFSKIRGDICKSSAPPVSMTPAANLPPAPPIFAAGVNDIGGNLSPVSTTLTANLANNENTYQIADTLK